MHLLHLSLRLRKYVTGPYSTGNIIGKISVRRA
jgi:hypothetical protein